MSDKKKGAVMSGDDIRGLHSDSLMVLVDEFSGISEETWEEINE